MSHVQALSKGKKNHPRSSRCCYIITGRQSQNLSKQWAQLVADGVFQNWFASIPAKAATLENAQVRNGSRWPVLGVPYWTAGSEPDSYDAEVAFTTGWLKTRFARLDYVLRSAGRTDAAMQLYVTPVDGSTDHH